MYFDPLCTPENICAFFNLSKATFYRYEAKIQAQKVRIGVGVESQTIKNFTYSRSQRAQPIVHYDIDFARRICKELNLRGNISFLPSHKLEEQANLGKFDFSLASFSKADFRKDKFYMSDHYFQEIYPSGLLARTHSHPINLAGAKPLLGVLAGTVHESFARCHLQSQFMIKSYRSRQIFEKHIRTLKLDFCLAHEQDELFLKCKTLYIKKYSYDCDSGIIVDPKSEHLLESINKTMDKILSSIDESMYFPVDYYK